MCASIQIKDLGQKTGMYSQHFRLPSANSPPATVPAEHTAGLGRAFSSLPSQARAAMATLPPWLQVHVEPNPLGWTNNATALLNKYRPGAAIFVVSSGQAASCGGR